ncbi:MAG: hypothetical protein KDA91_01005 [Planctomycetaceae bacterium]|nr:hypothetical protein [Planctomycetaceae bacterium]
MAFRKPRLNDRIRGRLPTRTSVSQGWTKWLSTTIIPRIVWTLLPDWMTSPEAQPDPKVVQRTRMSKALRNLLTHRTLSPEEQQQVFREIHDTVLMQSEYITEPNFRTFHPDDLKLMFQQYDQKLLNGACLQALGERPLGFLLSKRMTRAGGKTTWKTIRNRLTGSVREEFEIAVSSHLLFQNFRDETRSVTVTGFECQNRLEAMQRIVEHEIVHLSERLAWNTSNCRARRFQSIAERLFGHRVHTHDLVTTNEMARRQLGIRVGTQVRFDFEGHAMKGIVNRITKRVTVLVPDARGTRYSDGQRYTKYYIPLGMLSRVD